MKKVSIIVPVYNSAKYLRTCLDSLVNQSLDDIEIICVDDKSNDESLTILNEYEKQYDFIKVIRHDINQGIGKTRNDGIKIAMGEYLGFVDSDDYISKDMYEKYYNYAKTNDLDMVYASYYKVIDGKAEIFKRESFEIGDIHHHPEILLKVEFEACDKLYRKELIDKYHIEFDETLKYEDVKFVSEVLYHARIGFLDGAYYFYVIHDYSESTTIDKRCFDIIEVMNKLTNYYKDINYDELEMLNITQITRYMLRQRYQVDKDVKDDFINQGYKYLDDNFSNWRNNKYYLKQSIIKRIIKSNKNLLKWYAKL